MIKRLILLYFLMLNGLTLGSQSPVDIKSVEIFVLTYNELVVRQKVFAEQTHEFNKIYDEFKKQGQIDFIKRNLMTLYEIQRDLLTSPIGCSSPTIKRIESWFNCVNLSPNQIGCFSPT